MCVIVYGKIVGRLILKMIFKISLKIFDFLLGVSFVSINANVFLLVEEHSLKAFL